MEPDKKTIVIHTRVPKKLEQQLRHLVDEGYYSNISDALRDAARKLVAEHQHLMHPRERPPKFELKKFEI